MYDFFGDNSLILTTLSEETVLAPCFSLLLHHSLYTKNQTSPTNLIVYLTCLGET